MILDVSIHSKLIAKAMQCQLSVLLLLVLVSMLWLKRYHQIHRLMEYLLTKIELLAAALTIPAAEMRLN